MSTKMTIALVLALLITGAVALAQDSEFGNMLSNSVPQRCLAAPECSIYSQRVRTSGEFEYGPMLILGQETAGHRLRFYENIGYIHTGDISRGGVKVLALRDKALLNAGVSFAFNKRLELLGEAAGTVYLGDGTASLEKIDPLDGCLTVFGKLRLEARFPCFSMNTQLQLGGGESPVGRNRFNGFAAWWPWGNC